MHGKDFTFGAAMLPSYGNLIHQSLCSSAPDVKVFIIKIFSVDFTCSHKTMLQEKRPTLREKMGHIETSTVM